MHIVIIGNGISGITAARTLRKHSDHEITVISGETDHFFSRTALMYIYMGHMRYQETKPYEDWFWSKNRINLKKAWVKQIDTDNNHILFSDDSGMHYDRLLIASGSKSNKFGWPGQDLDGVQGLYSFQDLEAMERTTKHGISRAVIVGGGLIGIEMAEMLHSRHYPVTLLVREQSYWNNVLPAQESAMITRHIREHGFDLRLGVELKEILDDGTGKVKGVVTSEGETIDCQLVGLTAGVSPNIEFVKSSKIVCGRGIIVNQFQQTNINGVYAAGDCAQMETPPADRRPIEQVWYTGKIQGETAALNILGRPTAYNPGYWYNSAKFLDIEYQTYGMVLPVLREGEEAFYWEDANGKRSIHLVWRKQDRRFIGINNFGIRLRHTTFNHWLKQQATVDEVLRDIRAAAFDPEFFKPFEKELISAWNIQFPDHQIQLNNKRSLRARIFHS
ncbi:MAG: FAD-dependent oxidoreductase [Chitinophagales bacterium]|nr:FAD-dependent oxidoreductase [Chitinophagales bacterium]HAE14096.1 FAD-dependent oxidoreductase [Bacteroidota bacterium]MCB9021415.1 FAD-dependent oxidoreductase [Chitinophagales bacterium]HAE35650.1 FAD-dependent oxidoreductase [Bacteroidota bacterium]HPR29515.1 FAD-dependent oxidoreductase [Chitinophagales bacterium]